MATGSRRERTIKQKLTDIVPEYIARYIIWKFDSSPNKRTFDEWKVIDTTHMLSEEHCDDWLTRADAQQAMQMYLQHMKKYNLIKVYNTMLDKAVNGDVKSAQWVENFSRSEFFKEDEDDEIDEFLSDINIPALNGGGK